MNEIETPLEKKNFFKSKPLAGFAFSTACFKRVAQGFTLMEIVVSLLILATVFAGITATFVGVKRYVSRATRRLTAVNLGKEALNALYIQSRADTWDTGALTAGRHNFGAGAVTEVPDSVTIDNFTYGSTAVGGENAYTVRAIGTRQYREVTADVWYPTN